MSKSMEEILLAASRKTDKIFASQDGNKPVEISPSPAEEVEFKSRRRKHKTFRDRPIEDWGVSDLLGYTKSRFYEKFGYSFPVALANGFTEMKRVQEEIRVHTGDWPSAELTRSYIDWFIDVRAPELIAQYRVFKAQMIRHPINVANFVDRFKLRQTPGSVRSKKFDKKDSQVVFSGDVSGFVTTYGMVLALAYFMRSGKTKEQSIKIVGQALKMAVNEGKFSDFVAATEQNGPYHDSLKFDGFDTAKQEISALSGKRLSLLNIVFSDNAKAPTFGKEV